MYIHIEYASIHTSSAPSAPFTHFPKRRQQPQPDLCLWLESPRDELPIDAEPGAGSADTARGAEENRPDVAAARGGESRGRGCCEGKGSGLPRPAPPAHPYQPPSPHHQSPPHHSEPPPPDPHPPHPGVNPGCCKKEIGRKGVSGTQSVEGYLPLLL